MGVLAPILLLLLRIIQGFAVGGEYGGAATYVAEHAPADRRGRVTSWIQSSAAFGLGGTLAVIFICRTLLGEAGFEAWGWRFSSRSRIEAMTSSNLGAWPKDHPGPATNVSSEV